MRMIGESVWVCMKVFSREVKKVVDSEEKASKWLSEQTGGEEFEYRKFVIE